MVEAADPLLDKATHNLARLLEMLNAHNAEVERFAELVEFTPYATDRSTLYYDPRVAYHHMSKAGGHLLM